MSYAENKSVDGTSEKLLDGLITVIGEESLLFEKFLELLERQQRALVRNDADELKTVTIQLQQVAAQSQKLEHRRIDMVEHIRRLDGAGSDLTVAQICDLADSERSTQLRQLRETVLALYARIEETRMRNGLLIEQSMEQIRNTVETIGRIPAQKETYLDKGGLSRDYAPLGVDRRV